MRVTTLFDTGLSPCDVVRFLPEKPALIFPAAVQPRDALSPNGPSKRCEFRDFAAAVEGLKVESVLLFLRFLIPHFSPPTSSQVTP